MAPQGRAPISTRAIVQPWRSAARNWLRISLIACLGALFFGAADARAGGLEDFLTDLYKEDGFAGIQLAGSDPGRPQGDADFSLSSLERLAKLNSALASSLGFFSLNSGVSGYTLDLVLGVPVRTTESLGPLIAERAETLGARKLSLAFSYTRLDFKRFEANRLSDISVIVESRDLNGDGMLGPPGTLDVELDTINLDLDIDIEQDIFALFARYGVAEHWDVGVVVPILRNRVRAEAKASLKRFPTADGQQSSKALHNFFQDICAPDCSDPEGDRKRSTIRRSASGFGDVLLRTKYNFLRDKERWPDLAVRGQIKLPTGKEADLLGTGHTNFELLLIASRQFGRFAPHLNVSYELTTGPSDLDCLRYVVGFDARIHRRLTLALETTGRWAPNEKIGGHVVDFVVGGKWNVYRSLLLDVNFQIPLNRNQGLRPDFIWSLGLEYLF